MLITGTQTHTHTLTYRDTHAHRPNAKCDFRNQEISKRVNPSKSPFQKFDPKTVLSLFIGKRK